MTFQVKIGKFGDDDSADISVDGRVVGGLERVRGERFASVTSRARVSFVSHYSIMLTDDFADDRLRKFDVDSRAAAKLEVAGAFERAWEKLAAASGRLCCGCSKRLAADPRRDRRVHARPRRILRGVLRHARRGCRPQQPERGQPMTSQSTLIRRTDGKKFKVVDLAHWSTIAAEDGEQDSVKWYGDGYVSANKGHSYFLMKCAHVVDNYTNEICGAAAPCREHK